MIIVTDKANTDYVQQDHLVEMKGLATAEEPENTVLVGVPANDHDFPLLTRPPLPTWPSSSPPGATTKAMFLGADPCRSCRCCWSSFFGRRRCCRPVAVAAVGGRNSTFGRGGIAGGARFCCSLEATSRPLAWRRRRCSRCCCCRRSWGVGGVESACRTLRSRALALRRPLLVALLSRRCLYSCRAAALLVLLLEPLALLSWRRISAGLGFRCLSL